MPGASPSCFALPPSGSSRHRRRSWHRACASGNGAEPTTSTTTRRKYPPFVPSEAAAIQCTRAQEMLSCLLQTPIATSTYDATIPTVHVAYSSGTLSTSPPAVLCLHGFDSSVLEFRHLLAHLSAGGADAYALDMLGCGLTGSPSGVLADVCARREHLRSYWSEYIGRPVTLVGASLGGAAAIDFAVACPEAVERLVLVDAQAFQDRPAPVLLNKYPVLAGIGAEVLRARWLRWIAILMSYEDKRFRSEDTLRIGGLHCNVAGWKEATVEFIRREGYCVSRLIEKVNQQTLVLWGEKDRILPKTDALKFKQSIPNCKLHFIQGAGHSPHIEKADLIAKHILKFIRDEPVQQVRERLSEEVAQGSQSGSLQV